MEYFVVDGRMPCAIAVIEKSINMGKTGCGQQRIQDNADQGRYG